MSIDSPWDDDEPSPPTPGWLWVVALLLCAVLLTIASRGGR